MTKSIRTLLLAGAAAIAAAPALAADVTADRLVNADKEPQNWLMNHRTYDAQRYSPLDKINKANVKNLKLAYAVAIGGTSANENLQATPLAEDGFLYVVDQWGVVYKIDARSGDMGRIVWRMDPGQEKLPLSNRGAALWGNLVISSANYPPAHHRHQQGQRQGRLGDEPVRRPGRICSSPRHRSRSRTRSSSAPPAATAACAISSRHSTARPASWFGANTSSRHRASPAARPGRTRTTPGRPAAAPCGSPAPTMRRPTR